MDEYSRAVHKLYKLLMSMLSINLGLEPEYLETAFGAGASHVLRINYYPTCPQPHLTLGLGSHSDVGGLTILLQDEVLGLELKKDENWILVEPIPNALAINIGDQLQVGNWLLPTFFPALLCDSTGGYSWSYQNMTIDRSGGA
jgi:isopenicillin N synthase-like dioxygenase